MNHIHTLDFIQLRKLLALCGLLLSCLFLSVFLYFLNFHTRPVYATEKEVVCELVPVKHKVTKVSWDLTEGPLALSDRAIYIPYPNLGDEIVLLGRNDRPDADKKLLKVMLGLRGLDHKQELTVGEKIFLNYNEQGMRFDRTRTPLWIRPIFKGKELVLESGLHLKGQSGEGLVKEKKEFHLHTLPQKAVDLDVLVGILQTVRGYAPDQVLALYGGDRYRTVKDRPRFEIECGGKFETLFLGKGDVLVWKRDRFELANCGAQTRDHSIAQVVDVREGQVAFRVWDHSGFYSENVTCQLATHTPIMTRMDELFSRIRQRTLTSVSCKMGGKSAILRRGDWILHLPTGWKILKSAQELGQFLEYKIQGELFVFDGIEKDSGGAYFTGHLFDKTRSSFQAVRLPLMEKKRSQKMEQKKQESEELPPLFDDDFDDEFELDEML